MTVTMITCSLTGGSLLFSLLFFSQLDLFGNSFLFLFYQFFSYSLFSQAPLFIMYLFFPLFNFFNKSCIFFCLTIFFFLSLLFTQLVPNVSGYLSIEKKELCQTPMQFALRGHVGRADRDHIALVTLEIIIGK